MRIALAGFQHETNTFAPSQAGLAEFKMADSWPPLLTGPRVVSETRGMNLPIAGAAARAAEAGVEPVPLLWCAAEPSGPVTDAAFEAITEMILEGLSKAAPVDGLYLDLHGAMVTQSHASGEVALLERLRAAMGPRPIAVSLDLHANIAPRLVALADLVTIYRTYPHLDMAATGARAMAGLVQMIGAARPAKALRQAPCLIPLHAQFTGAAPCAALYDAVAAMDRGPLHFADLALGFTAADVPDCGAALVAYAPNQREANAMAEALLSKVMAATPQFDTRLFSPAEAVTEAMARPGPVVIADVQDNPGAGGSSDTTGLARALIAAGAGPAVLGVLADAAAANAAHAAGESAVISLTLGGRSGVPGDAPLAIEAQVLRLSDGGVAYSGAMYRGGVAQLGPSALLDVQGTAASLHIVVSSTRIQCLDQALFRHFGVVLEAQKIIGVKSTVHYRADFDPISTAVLNCAAPGAFPCRLALSDYRNLRPGMGIAGPG